jgi:phage-related protein
MKSVNATFIAQKNSRSNKPLCLFTLFDYRGDSTNLCYARNNEDVVYDGVTYHASGIEFKTVPENIQGEIDVIDIVVLNVSRLIQSYLENYDLRDKKIVIRLVWADQLTVPNTHLDFTFHIESYSSNDTDAHFVCTNKMDLKDIVLPTEVFSRNHCTHRRFKDALTCGYAGAETTCNRTKQRCKELGNYRRFGGKPSMPSSSNYVI